MEDAIQKMLRTTAQLIDMSLNGESLKNNVREVGFVLAIFPYQDLKKIHYVSGMDNARVLQVLKTLIQNIETGNIDFTKL